LPPLSSNAAGWRVHVGSGKIDTIQPSDFILNLRLVTQDLSVIWTYIKHSIFVLFSGPDISGPEISFSSSPTHALFLDFSDCLRMLWTALDLERLGSLMGPHGIVHSGMFSRPSLAHSAYRCI